jgi:ABC-type sugar transport system permease subunit
VDHARDDEPERDRDEAEEDDEAERVEDGVDEIGVCLTVTIIAALAAFDIVYVSTGGGPGNATAVPGIEIYILAFLERQVGLASALAVVLMVLVLIVILPIQRLTRESGR